MSPLDTTKSAIEPEFPLKKGFFQSADKLSPNKNKRLPTGSKNLDNLLGGGLEIGEITQFFGPPTSGKTHLCHVLAACQPLNFQCIFIDTGGTFRKEKIVSISQARKLDSSSILKNTHYVHPISSKEQEECTKSISPIVKANPRIKLVIIDSLMFHYRSEFSGRSILPERQHKLNIYMYKLSQIAQTSNVAIIITNQSTSSPNPFVDAQPIGGNIVSNLSAYIVELERGSFENVYARLVKNPISESKKCHLIICNSGFVDMEYG